MYIFQQPITEIKDNHFIMYSHIKVNYSGEYLILNKAEASALMIELYKFISNDEQINNNLK